MSGFHFGRWPGFGISSLPFDLVDMGKRVAVVGGMRTVMRERIRSMLAGVRGGAMAVMIDLAGPVSGTGGVPARGRAMNIDFHHVDPVALRVAR